jgi:hypothetical protein
MYCLLAIVLNGLYGEETLWGRVAQLIIKAGVYILENTLVPETLGG